MYFTWVITNLGERSSTDWFTHTEGQRERKERERERVRVRARERERERERQTDGGRHTTGEERSGEEWRDGGHWNRPVVTTIHHELVPKFYFKLSHTELDLKQTLILSAVCLLSLSPPFSTPSLSLPHHSLTQNQIEVSWSRTQICRCYRRCREMLVFLAPTVQ